MTDSWFDDGAVEEVRIGRGPESHGIGEHEVPEIIVADEAVHQGFVDFVEYLLHRQPEGDQHGMQNYLVVEGEATVEDLLP